MTALAPFAALAALTGPAAEPLAESLSTMVQASDRLSSSLFRSDMGGLPLAIAEARTALSDLQSRRTDLLREAAPAGDDEIYEQLERLVHAFPQGSPEDLAGYGAQLADDVTALRPSRRALRLGCEQVRLHHRYTRLPAIATVWDAVRVADAELRLATARLEALPQRIRQAEAKLRPKPPRALPGREGAEAAA